MATTTNFGWETPDDTDLVKDGAAAMRTLGNSIDTSFVDLKGGTSGQMLTKASNTDLDYTWVTPEIGDITAITATSPLTGGGTTGAVTVGILDGTTSNKGAVQLSTSTSSTSTSLAATASAVKSAYDLADGAIPKSLIDAAGDLIVGTAADTAGRLAKGTAGQVLQVNSGATALEWATPATSSGSVVFIKKVDFTSASTIDFSDSFSSTYDNYWLSGTFTSTDNGDLNFRYRVSGSDNSTSNYHFQLADILGTGTNIARITSQSAGRLCGIKTGGATQSLSSFLYAPYLSKGKNWINNAAVYNDANIYINQISGGFSAATSFTGLTVYPSSGTVTGTLYIYGYKNS